MCKFKCVIGTVRVNTSSVNTNVIFATVQDLEIVPGTHEVRMAVIGERGKPLPCVKLNCHRIRNPVVAQAHAALAQSSRVGVLDHKCKAITTTRSAAPMEGPLDKQGMVLAVKQTHLQFVNTSFIILQKLLGLVS